MKTKQIAALTLLLLIFQASLRCCSPIKAFSDQTPQPEVFIGVDVAYENFTEIKSFIDEAASYMNLFVIGCKAITHNITRLNETCQYLYDKGLYFIVYSEEPPQTEFLEEAEKNWDDRFLGFYAFDEVGGCQLDYREYRAVLTADNYTDAANQFVDIVNHVLDWYTINYTDSTKFPLFTSDYALYWFDYKAGYDVVLAQLGWNYSRQLNIALCRGAATVQNKDWGVIITWTYTEPPYMESGEELYKDLVLAYDNGAKYIVVFDSNKEYTHGILEEEHLQALRQFWEYAQNNPRNSIPVSDRVAFLLPKDYAYGFRGPDDKIWGFWNADDFSYNLSVTLGKLFTDFEDSLDIVYDDGLHPGNPYGYSKLLYWNDPSLSPTPTSTENPVSPMNYIIAIVIVTSIVAAAASRILIRKRREKSLETNKSHQKTACTHALFKAVFSMRCW